MRRRSTPGPGRRGAAPSAAAGPGPARGGRPARSRRWPASDASGGGSSPIRARTAAGSRRCEVLPGHGQPDERAGPLVVRAGLGPACQGRGRGRAAGGEHHAAQVQRRRAALRHRQRPVAGLGPLEVDVRTQAGLGQGNEQVVEVDDPAGGHLGVRRGVPGSCRQTSRPSAVRRTSNST